MSTLSPFCTLTAFTRPSLEATSSCSIFIASSMHTRSPRRHRISHRHVYRKHHPRQRRANGVVPLIIRRTPTPRRHLRQPQVRLGPRPPATPSPAPRPQAPAPDPPPSRHFHLVPLRSATFTRSRNISCPSPKVSSLPPPPHVRSSEVKYLAVVAKPHLPRRPGRGLG